MVCGQAGQVLHADGHVGELVEKRRGRGGRRVGYAELGLNGEVRIEAVGKRELKLDTLPDDFLRD